MKTIFFLFITTLAFGQGTHCLNNNGTITCYPTRAAYDAAVALISPTDAAQVSRYLAINAEQRIADGLADDLFNEFQRQIDLGQMTVTESLDVFTRTQLTFLLIEMGRLRAARMAANNTATGGSFTLTRKNFLLNQIDAAIARLP